MRKRKGTHLKTGKKISETHTGKDYSTNGARKNEPIFYTHTQGRW